MGKDSEMEAEEGFSKPAIEALSEDLLAVSALLELLTACRKSKSADFCTTGLL